jgi:hypothetical protein
MEKREAACWFTTIRTTQGGRHPESGQLRFSDIFVQNDPSELRHGLTVAIDIFKLRATIAGLELATFASVAVGHFFICCFSNRSDDLG